MTLAIFHARTSLVVVPGKVPLIDIPRPSLALLVQAC